MHFLWICKICTTKHNKNYSNCITVKNRIVYDDGSETQMCEYAYGIIAESVEFIHVYNFNDNNLVSGTENGKNHINLNYTALMLVFINEPRFIICVTR